MSKSGLTPEFLGELKNKIDIVELISSYVAVERKGGNYWARCPFHHEKTPSFSINASEQFYHCFGCGVSGDAITFIREIESVDFIDAVKILCEHAKIPMPEVNFETEKTLENKKKRDEMLKIMKASARFYLNNLNSGKADAHVQYILDRKLSSTVVRKFGLGASLNYYDLPQFLLDSGYSKQNIIDCGVCIESARNHGLSDAQGGRLIFPIINAMDDVVAFGGRVLEKTDFAKYKNTGATALFDKSKNLYNINLLKKEKKATGLKDVIIVEGYMDTISLYQAGFTNVVASMGTALTKDQARLCKRYSDNVYICYDGDGAGQKGAVRGLEIMRDEQINVRVVPLPDGLDPDDVIKRYGNEGYRQCLNRAMPLIDFKLSLLDKQFDITKTEEKRAYISAALKIINEEESASVKEDLLKTVRDKTGTTYEALKRDLDNSPTQPKADIIVERKVDDGSDKIVKSCRFILASVLFKAKYAKNFDVSSVEFENIVHNKIAEYIIKQQKKGEEIRASALFEIFEENTPELSEILDLSLGDRLEGEDAVKYFEDSLKVLERNRIERDLKELSTIHDMETDISRKREYAKEILKLTIKLKNF